MIQQVLSGLYLDRFERLYLTHFASYYSITYYAAPKYIRFIEFGAHFANIEKARDLGNAIHTDGLAMIHRPMACSILPAFLQLSGVSGARFPLCGSEVAWA